jgi:hypothetical protein
MPLQSTSGAASYDAFGGGTVAKVNYIEDFFQSYLRTGTGASATVTTGLDGSTKETLVWTKSRSAATNHKLTDNVRGATKALSSNTTSAEATDSQGLTAFSATGYTLGTNTDYNNSGATYVDWQWVSQPKFFDVVTYTGNGADNRAIPHSLGSAPGFIVVKRTDSASNWFAYQRQLDFGEDNVPIIYLNTTDGQSFTGMAFQTQVGIGNSNNPALNFIVRTPANANGATYVAYLFAHNAGGFGLTGTDNVISCGSFTASSGAATISLGYEPAWVLMKQTNGADNWYITDSMREFLAPPLSATQKTLRANTSGAELDDGLSAIAVTSTGFDAVNVATTGQYIYIAIRRGPMKVPTDATKVFTPVQNSNFTAGVVISGQSRVDMSWSKQKDGANSMRIFDRLRGSSQFTNPSLFPNSTGAESNSAIWALDEQNGVRITDSIGTLNYINYFYTRAPSFFDVVCYTGTGSARTVAHNLGVVPELMIVKRRNASGYWLVYSATIGATKALYLNDTSSAVTDSAYWNNTSPTSTVFTVNTDGDVNAGGGTYVAYLFATCAGVSKCTSFTGTGTLQTIDCGFTAGSRFVLIKRTDSTGDWYVWDSSRGLSSSTDPYLLLNSTAAEVTSTNWVDTTSTGFQVTAASGNNVNINGASYIALAIA